jgi:hypothetical protein
MPVEVCDDPDRGRRSQNRGFGDRGFASDAVRRNALHPLDCTLSNQEEGSIKALDEERAAGSDRSIRPRSQRSAQRSVCDERERLGTPCLSTESWCRPGSLINDTAIKLYEAHECDGLEYFNGKLESHDVIYADGAPAETLLNLDEYAVNCAEYFRMYCPRKRKRLAARPLSPTPGPQPIEVEGA